MSNEANTSDKLLAHIDGLLERERAFREDFSHSLKREILAHIDHKLDRLLARPQALPLTQSARVFMHTNDGHRLILDMNEKFMALHLLEHGQWEDHLRRVMAAILTPGGTYIDIGANIGVHLLYAGHLVGASGKCIAFEPHPVTYAICHENLEINGLLERVLLFDEAVSDVAGQVLDFEYFTQHPAMSGFKVSEARLEKFHGDVQTIKVKTTTIDAVIKAQDIEPDLIKIDIEGFEILALKGGVDTIGASARTCYVIEHEKALTCSVLGYDPIAEIYDMFAGKGYVALALRSDLTIVQLDRDAIVQDNTTDYLFIRPDGPHWPQIAALMA
ncbi:FkbM family methyltransferase [Asticcacaulis sp. ZE23SCel15]|uniref:FkbM family methyltransferase n=1 Tax=Asticcacaulis sp. ZE23SCel15 TaxID=3059027 RepID=UPI00265FA544|nr:FkbM family methyltransferase [Asticcacaulis sp. ZE23SCel15]WKL58555.1 FkbM family methyltransferase [Asticcacaulis sp. ZE23SCel15]